MLAWPTDEPLIALISPGAPGLPAQGASVLAMAGDRLNPEAFTCESGVLAAGASAPGISPGSDGAWEGLGAPFLGRSDRMPVACVLDYALGRVIEPTGRAASNVQRRRLGDAIALRSRAIHEAGAWRSPGESSTALRDFLDRGAGALPDGRAFALGPMRSRQGRAHYERIVAQGVGFIRAGDVFQVNLAHELTCSFRGDARALFAQLVRSARPAYAAYVELPDRVVVSLSPELLVHYDALSRRCVTRPMKGTARAHVGGLDRSPKDLAELRMIVDLMRNDLARVCEIGSVRVERERDIERHADLLQGVATVSGTLREGKRLPDLIRAVFPSGSITGAPKVRAMQIIDELEGFDRGVYCGSIALIDERGATMSVAIRTATITGERSSPGVFRTGEIVYPVGAGIVADSTPESEWRETIAKASLWNGVTTIDAT